jgi:hypothetical protein
MPTGSGKLPINQLTLQRLNSTENRALLEPEPAKSSQGHQGQTNASGMVSDDELSRKEQIDRLEAKLQMLRSSMFSNLFCVI